MNLRLRLDIHCSSVRSSSRPPGELPAQVTRMSILPKRSRVTSTQRWTCSVTLMSPASGSTVRPVAAAIFSAAASSGPAVLAVMTTSQPSRARNSATQRPMPLLAPVTKATLPSSRRSTATPFGLGGWMVYQISGARKIRSEPVLVQDLHQVALALLSHPQHGQVSRELGRGAQRLVAGPDGEQEAGYPAVGAVSCHGRQWLDRLQVHGQGISRAARDRGVREPQPLLFPGDSLRSSPGGIHVTVVDEGVDEDRSAPGPVRLASPVGQLQAQQGQRLFALRGPPAGVLRGSPQRLIARQGAFRLEPLAAQGEQLIGPVSRRVPGGQVLDELGVWVCRLAHTPLGPAERLGGTAGSVKFAGDEEVAPAVGIEIGGVDGDDAVYVAFVPEYRLHQLPGPPARRAFRVGVGHVLADGGDSRGAQQLAVLVEVGPVAVLLLQQQLSDVGAKPVRIWPVGLAGAQVHSEQLPDGVVDRAQ